MLIEEGMDYHFIHKSVQEFYSARFLSRRADDFAISFYKHALDHFPEWQQEINFLETLDKLRATEHFKIPAINKIKAQIKEEGAKYLLDGSVYTISDEHQIDSLMTRGANSLILYYSKEFLDHGLDNPLVEVMEEYQDLPEDIALKARKFHSRVHSRFKHRKGSEDNSFMINAYDFLTILDDQKRLDKIVEMGLDVLEEDLRKANEILEDEDALKDLSF